jgi:hypothetical protein
MIRREFIAGLAGRLFRGGATPRNGLANESLDELD